VLLKEVLAADPFRAAHHRERAARNAGQRVIGDRTPVFREVLLGDSRPQFAVGCVSSTLPMVTPRRLGARADTMALLRRGGTATTGPRCAAVASPGRGRTALRSDSGSAGSRTTSAAVLSSRRPRYAA
jgi:hypothetical protein